MPDNHLLYVSYRISYIQSSSILLYSERITHSGKFDNSHCKAIIKPPHILLQKGTNTKMENLIFCLNATIPIFLTLMLGLFFRKAGLFDESFVSKMNKFVFKAALPALLFQDIADMDIYSVWDGKMVLFCFFATLISILISIGFSFLLKPRDIQGEFVQASYRSSAAVLGIAIIQNMYGDAGMAPLMIVASVPLITLWQSLYCVCSVLAIQEFPCQ